MSELNEKQLADLARERAKIFTPAWFGDLLAARLSFGDTFWLGLFGVLLFVVPAVVLIGGVLVAQAHSAVGPFLRLIAGAYALWAAAVLQALVRIGPRGGWGITGGIVTAGLLLAGFYGATTL